MHIGFKILTLPYLAICRSLEATHNSHRNWRGYTKGIIYGITVPCIIYIGHGYHLKNNLNTLKIL